MKMEYKTFAIIGIMWAFCAHCSVGDSKLTHQKFPKTVNDLSFIEMMQLKAEGYKPWFDKQAYVPIVLKDGGGKQQAAEPIDYCPDNANYAWPESAGGEELAQVALSAIAWQGSVDCEPNVSISETTKCAKKCVLSSTVKEHKGDVCVYANVDNVHFDGQESGRDDAYTFATDESEDFLVIVLFDSIEKDAGIQIGSNGEGILTQVFNKGVKLGKITNKNDFYYCIMLIKNDAFYCADGQTEWGGCEGNNSASDAGDSSDTDAPAGEGS